MELRRRRRSSPACPTPWPTGRRSGPSRWSAASRSPPTDGPAASFTSRTAWSGVSGPVSSPWPAMPSRPPAAAQLGVLTVPRAPRQRLRPGQAVRDGAGGGQSAGRFAEESAWTRRLRRRSPPRRSTRPTRPTTTSGGSPFSTWAPGHRVGRVRRGLTLRERTEDAAAGDLGEVELVPAVQLDVIAGQREIGVRHLHRRPSCRCRGRDSRLGPCIAG